MACPFSAVQYNIDFFQIYFHKLYATVDNTLISVELAPCHEIIPNILVFYLRLILEYYTI